MMSGTHLAVGMTAAILAARPTNPDEFISAAIGGAIGGIICDIDAARVKGTNHGKDALMGRVVAAAVSAALLAANAMLGGTVLTYLTQGMSPVRSAVGLAIFCALCFFGRRTPHRSFTHSVLAFGLFTGAVFMFCPALGLPFAVGFLSHLTLDIFNKMPVRLLYPMKKGWSLKLCYAKSAANNAVMVAGLVALAVITAVYTAVLRRNLHNRLGKGNTISACSPIVLTPS